MRRFLGRVTLGVSLGIVFVTSVASEVKAAPIYRLTLSITDDTTSTTTVFTIANGGSNDTNPSANGITVSGALDTSATGVSLTGINSNTLSTASAAFLGIGGDATVAAGSTDMYTIVITATHDSYNFPSGTNEFLSQSESGTYSFTNAGNTQSFQSC
jgi:hypothetical protein